MERWQVTSLGAMVFKERCCRLSYGVLCSEEYDPESNPTHINQKVFKSPHDGKLWVEGQIDWFLKQVCGLLIIDTRLCLMAEISKGDTVSSDGILKPYSLKVKPGHYKAKWQTHVVMCGLPREHLPTNFAQSEVSRLCDIKSSLEGKDVDMKEKNRHWYNRGERYLRVNFNIRVILGPADVKFRMESKGREVLSDDHDSIQVIWEPIPEKSSRPDSSNEVHR